MSLNDLNISKKLALGFAGVVTIVTAMCVGVFLNLQSIKTAVADNDVEVAQLEMSHDVELQVIERQNGVRGFAITGDKSFLKSVDGALAKYHEVMADWIKIAPEDTANTSAIKAEVDAIFAEQDRQVAMAADPATHEAALIDLGKKGRLNKIRALLKAYQEAAGGQAPEGARPPSEEVDPEDGRPHAGAGRRAFDRALDPDGLAAEPRDRRSDQQDDRRDGHAGTRATTPWKSRPWAARTRSAGWPMPCSTSRMRPSRRSAWKPKPPSSAGRRKSSARPPRPNAPPPPQQQAQVVDARPGPGPGASGRRAC